MQNVDIYQIALNQINQDKFWIFLLKLRVSVWHLATHPAACNIIARAVNECAWIVFIMHKFKSNWSEQLVSLSASAVLQILNKLTDHVP